ncbi:hypothetical protein [Brevibacillus nitrificans]|uniref:hypothetical protein n=1 Tax=Brevibacillus nitrificans TaxID=651560 RepID=UPI00262084D0|nr:hypothetical protein [Brevibacillus nitrificans]
MAEEINGVTEVIPVKVPIPAKLLAITDMNKRSAVMKDWWAAYAKRYPDYKAVRKDNQFVYMVKRNGGETP